MVRAKRLPFTLHQHILGNCSPEIISTILVEPTSVLIFTIGDPPVTIPIIAAYFPKGCFLIALIVLSAYFSGKIISSFPSLAI
jgi:hypothetical protein